MTTPIWKVAITVAVVILIAVAVFCISLAAIYETSVHLGIHDSYHSTTGGK